jgi:hypothetical protein
LGFNGNLTLYLGEIVSFNIRTTGIALNQLTGSCVNLIFQYATPIGLENIGWKYFIVHIPWIMIEFVVVYLVFPETKGYALEEISVLFGELIVQYEDLVLLTSVEGNNAPVTPAMMAHDKPEVHQLEDKPIESEHQEDTK